MSQVPVVAIVTQFYDQTGASHVRVQPPGSERPGGTELATSQIDLGPAQGAYRTSAEAGRG